MLKNLIFSVFMVMCVSAVAVAENTKTTVYYFHGNVRCYTCNNMERFTVSAIKSNFSKELEKGFIEINVVNVDSPENEHFVKKYKLYTRSVVLVKDNGEWKNLDKIWSLAGKENEFTNYIVQETSAFTKE